MIKAKIYTCVDNSVPTLVSFVEFANCCIMYPSAEGDLWYITINKFALDCPDISNIQETRRSEKFTIEDMEESIEQIEDDAVREKMTSYLGNCRVGLKAKAYRQAQGLSLKDMARETGLSEGYLSIVERANSQFRLTGATASKLANAIDTVAGELSLLAGQIPADLQMYVQQNAYPLAILLTKMQSDPVLGRSLLSAAVEDMELPY